MDKTPKKKPFEYKVVQQWSLTCQRCGEVITGNKELDPYQDREMGIDEMYVPETDLCELTDGNYAPIKRGPADNEGFLLCGLCQSDLITWCSGGRKD